LLKFWWHEGLSLLKEASIESDKSWKAAGKPRNGPIFDKRQACGLKYRRIKEYEKCITESYASELHEALLQKNNTDFWKCWRSKFDSSNECNQAEGFVDPDIIAQKFYNHFKKSYTANNVRRAQVLKGEYLVMREKYCGFPNNNNSHFDTEAISRIIIDMKRGKAADIVRLTVEHMQHSIQFNLFPYSHSVVSVLLSKFFRLIPLSHYIPSGFKRMVTSCLPKRLKTVAPKAITFNDFRGIAISPILLNVYRYLEPFRRRSRV